MPTVYQFPVGIETLGQVLQADADGQRHGESQRPDVVHETRQGRAQSHQRRHARQAAGIARQDAGGSRKQQDIIKGKGFLGNAQRRCGVSGWRV